MKRFGSQVIGADQGEVILFSDFEDDGMMWVGAGTRTMRSHVQFSEPFVAPPVVTVGLSMWDISNGANARMDITAEEVRAEGFFIRFRTWGDTQVARCRASWLALGPLRDEDLWQVD